MVLSVSKSPLIGETYTIGPRKVLRFGKTAGLILGTKFRPLIGQYVTIQIKVIKLPPQQEGGGS